MDDCWFAVPRFFRRVAFIKVRYRQQTGLALALLNGTQGLRYLLESREHASTSRQEVLRFGRAGKTPAAGHCSAQPTSRLQSAFL